MIELKEVTKQFDDFKVLDKISLTIPKGAAFGLLGSNGAGKSTMMKVLTGVYQMDAGEILLDGKPVQIHNTRDAQALGKQTGMDARRGKLTWPGLHGPEAARREAESQTKRALAALEAFGEDGAFLHALAVRMLGRDR